MARVGYSLNLRLVSDKLAEFIDSDRTIVIRIKLLENSSYGSVVNVGESHFFYLGFELELGDLAVPSDVCVLEKLVEVTSSQHDFSLDCFKDLVHLLLLVVPQLVACCVIEVHVSVQRVKVNVGVVTLISDSVSTGYLLHVLIIKLQLRI